MSLNYPNGRPYHVNGDKQALKKQVKSKKPDYSNRGMTLESDLNITNEQYLIAKKAVIHKKPIPIQIVNVSYPKRSAAKITEAYYQKASTTDYNGIYKGFYLDFEAKETKNKTSFPLKNFHEHQILHMRACVEQDGICFIIIRFSSLNRVFVLSFDHLDKWWKQQKEALGKKSIPLKSIIEEAYEISYGFSPRLPYLEAVDKIIKSKKS
ncbi:Holliday junction resolvase RecU [Marinilactibacillus sp. 15R]|uniref:Holliday junction resolvase RecU n=1 Tax=Marinilactibacillus sp. 15R TaxID=1911586 RepID=UPI00090C5731|nr:Holliday junction resolvase RecU [Marinilactibacillus sp. 15R]API89455.1 Holliday junction resolvase RecU [Marinilactibacillus sp. 15R]